MVRRTLPFVFTAICFLLIGCSPPPTTQEIESMQLLRGWNLVVKCDNPRFTDYATNLGMSHGAIKNGEGDKIIIELTATDGDNLGFVDVTIGGMDVIDSIVDGEFHNHSKRARL